MKLKSTASIPGSKRIIPSATTYLQGHERLEGEGVGKLFSFDNSQKIQHEVGWDLKRLSMVGGSQ